MTADISYFPAPEIARDFRVRHIGRVGTLDWFLAYRGERRSWLRPQGARSIGPAVWHIVVASHSGLVPHLRQWCVPDYQMAASIRALDEPQSATRPDSVPLGDGLSLVRVAARSGLELGFRYENVGDPGAVAHAVRSELRASLAALSRASASVARERQWHVASGDAFRPAVDVRWATTGLVEAIAFERVSARTRHRVGGLEALYRAAPPARLRRRPLLADVRAMVDSLVVDSHGPASTRVRDALVNAQRRLLPEPIWADGCLELPRDRAVAVVADGLARLSCGQRHLCRVMTIELGASLVWPLVLIAGTITFDRYADLASAQVAPHSRYEFELRQRLAHLRLFCALLDGTLPWTGNASTAP